MPLDAFCLRAVTRELSETITGARIDKVQQPARDQVVLQLRGGMKLLLHAEGTQPRIHLTYLQRETDELLKLQLAGVNSVAAKYAAPARTSRRPGPRW